MHFSLTCFHRVVQTLTKEGIVLPREKALPSQREGIHRAIFPLARTIVSSLGSLVGFLSYHIGLQSPFPLDLIPHRTGSIEVHSKQREFLGTVDSGISLPRAWIKPTGCFLPPRLG